MEDQILESVEQDLSLDEVYNLDHSRLTKAHRAVIIAELRKHRDAFLLEQVAAADRGGRVRKAKSTPPEAVKNILENLDLKDIL
jgi:hypothetical protein